MQFCALASPSTNLLITWICFHFLMSAQTLYKSIITPSGTNSLYLPLTPMENRWHYIYIIYSNTSFGIDPIGTAREKKRGIKVVCKYVSRSKLMLYRVMYVDTYVYVYNVCRPIYMYVSVCVTYYVYYI